MSELQSRLDQLDRQHRWLWRTAIAGVLLLGGTIFFPSLRALWQADAAPLAFSSLGTLLAASGLVLLLTTYAAIQRRFIGQLRGELSEKIAEKSRLQTEMEGYHQFTMVDPITGLYNRRFLEQHLATELARSQRLGHPLNVLKIDLNHFVKINEAYGRAAGDQTLRLFAERLKKSLRNSDLSVRMGNDEFLVLLPESKPERVPHILARLSGLEIELGGEKVPIVFSAAWTSHQPGEPAGQLLERVDREVRADKLVHRSEEAVRRAQAESRQLQNIEALGRLAGKLTHDFNNMLNLVKGYSEIILEDLGHTDPLREYMEQIHQANERASSLTRELLSFTRQQASSPVLVDLNTLVTALEARLRRMLGDSIHLVFTPGEPLGGVQVHREELEQVILNLARNARDNMPQGGKLTLETLNVELDAAYARWHPGANPGSYVMLTARDTGGSLDADTRARIFEPFLTLHGKGKRTGLGLITVYELVKQWGGYVEVDSESEQSTRFKIYLPRAEKTCVAA
ncbi:MAG: diguanylate cyclase [Acidobacteria bacterium]|nr:diguanylate cyclase [Acidobacteriota bacterium]